MSLGLISHSKEKAATYAQARVDGATSGSQANQFSNREESLEAEVDCFITNLKKSKSEPIKFCRP